MEQGLGRGALAAVMTRVVTVMVMGEGLGGYGRDGKDGESGKGEHQIAKFHGGQFLPELRDLFNESSGAACRLLPGG